MNGQLIPIFAAPRTSLTDSAPGPRLHPATRHAPADQFHRHLQAAMDRGEPRRDEPLSRSDDPPNRSDDSSGRSDDLPAADRVTEVSEGRPAGHSGRSGSAKPGHQPEEASDGADRSIDLAGEVPTAPGDAVVSDPVAGMNPAAATVALAQAQVLAPAPAAHQGPAVPVAAQAAHAADQPALPVVIASVQPKGTPSPALSDSAQAHGAGTLAALAEQATGEQATGEQATGDRPAATAGPDRGPAPAAQNAAQPGGAQSAPGPMRQVPLGAAPDGARAGEQPMTGPAAAAGAQRPFAELVQLVQEHAAQLDEPGALQTQDAAGAAPATALATAPATDPAAGPSNTFAALLTHKTAAPAAAADLSAAARPAPVLDPRLVADQVAHGAARVALSVTGDRHEVRIKLWPRELGEVNLKLVMDNGALRADVVVSRPEVKAALESNLNDLRQRLAQQGLDVQSFEVALGGGGIGQGEHRSEPQFARRGRVPIRPIALGKGDLTGPEERSAARAVLAYGPSGRRLNGLA